MAENKLASPKSILIFVIVLFALIASLSVASYLSSVKNIPPVAVQPTPSPTITDTVTPTPKPSVISNINENFKIAYSLADGIYIANSDGTSARKVYDCSVNNSGNIGNCSVPFWLKDGRLISNIINGKKIDIGQDLMNDTDLVIIDAINNSAKIISRPIGYNNYNWNFSIDGLIIDDPLMLSQKDSDKNYYLFNPDKKSVAKISKKEVIVSDKNYFYFSDDTLTSDYGNKSEYIPNKNDDILLINNDLSCQISVYNTKTKEVKDIFDNCVRGKITIIADKKYELLKQGSCKLSQNSSYVACSMEDFAHIGGDHLLLLVDLKNNNKIILSYPHWSFQFSPDSQYLYFGSLPSNGTSGVAGISRYNIISKFSENIIRSVRSSGNATWVFALSPLVEK